MIRKALGLGVLSTALAVSFSACSPKVKQAPTAGQMSRLDSVSYAFGVLNAESFAKVLAKLPGDTLDRSRILDGFSAVLGQGTVRMQPEEARRLFESYVQEMQGREDKARLAQNDSVLAVNKNRPGVVVTPSGLQYRVLRPGTGARPKAEDTVTVHYVGKLIDGTQFDSSYERNEPATFPLERVIAGWTEGVALMQVGAKYEFYIPHTLGYGERGAGSAIPPYATLIFEVELLDVKSPVSANTEEAQQATEVKKEDKPSPRKTKKKK